MPIQSMSMITLEVLIVMIGAASLGTVAAEQSVGITPGSALSMWCLVGGCVGAFCSLHFYRVPPSAHANADIAWQFGVNVALSWAATPVAVKYVAHWTGQDIGSVLIPTSALLGLLAQRLVARALPMFQRILDAKQAKIEADNGVPTLQQHKDAAAQGAEAVVTPEGEVAYRKLERE